jgi:hypothetical protein
VRILSVKFCFAKLDYNVQHSHEEPPLRDSSSLARKLILQAVLCTAYQSLSGKQFTFVPL